MDLCHYQGFRLNCIGNFILDLQFTRQPLVLASKQLDIAGLVYVFYFYIVWVVFQAIAGITKKSTINLTTKPTEDTQFLMGTVCTIKVNNKNKSAALDDGLDRIKKLADEITINRKGSEVDKINAEAGQSFR